MNPLVQNILIWAPGVIFAITLHEWAHGFVASLYGDNTPARMGRLTINPLPHIDPIMTLLVPALMLVSSLLTVGTPFVFGGAKPVPVNPNNFRRSGKSLRMALFWVAVAGPLMNFILALLCVLLLRGAITIGWLPPLFFINMLLAAVQMNVLLGVFNLLPLPPLDGGRVMTALLPPPLDRAVASLERFGLPIVLVLAFSGLLGQVLSPILSSILRLFVGISGLS